MQRPGQRHQYIQGGGSLGVLNALHRELSYIRVVRQGLLAPPPRFPQLSQMHAEGLDTGRIFHGRKLTPAAQPAGITYLSKSDYFLPCGPKPQPPLLPCYAFPMPTAPLGERLHQLRLTLAAEAYDPKAWPRARVAREAGVTSAALTRLETTGRGTAASLGAVLHFYQDQGFNLAWVLVPDNEEIPLHAFRDVFEEEATREAGYHLDRVRQLLQPAATTLDAGQFPTPEALHSLLAHVKEGVYQAIGRLLPPIRLVLSTADLREYQRRLPPVQAAATGWRLAVVHAGPYHYYQAGESVPHCGNPAYYLTYDAGPKSISDTGKCLDCRAQLGERQGHLPLAGTVTPKKQDHF